MKQTKFKSASTVIRQIKKLEKQFAKMSNDELKLFIDLKKREISLTSNKEEALNVMIEEVYACVKEAAKRTLGFDAYKVQLEGAFYLHRGTVIEMKTGEGKTFTCTFPAILNSLAQKVHIVTVNEYLAKRDALDMGRLYDFLGITSSYVTSDMSKEEKREAYSKDIVYTTNSEIGFDYLRDNLVYDINEKIVPSLDYVIIDEADSILIDEARTPLILASQQHKDVSLYSLVDIFIKSLKRGKDKEIKIEGDELFNKQYEGSMTKEEMEILGDFTVDELNRKVVLTQRGIEKVEKFFKIKINEDVTFMHIVENALMANYIFKKDKDYIVHDNSVDIVDANTGRVLEGRQYSDGLHQALQAKENVKVTPENITSATITLQSFFKMYKKISGMTGTIETDRKEIKEVYSTSRKQSVEVRSIKTNKPVIREDLPDIIFKDKKDKYKYLVKLLKKNPKQPFLIGTSSVEESEQVSAILKDKKIEHKVLNAKQDKKESEIIAQAGRLSSVTVATNMAGRGTDILLGGNPSEYALQELKKLGANDEELFYAKCLNAPEEYQEIREKYLKLKADFKDVFDKEKEEVIKAGGLFVVGTTKNDSRRIDNQLRGRAGRQGDPGKSLFLVSLEDKNIEKLLSPTELKNIKTYSSDGEYKASKNTYASKMIRKAQKKIESMHYEARKNLLEYDKINDVYRKEFYKNRDEVLNNEVDVVSIIVENVGEKEVENNLKAFKAQLEKNNLDFKKCLNEIYLQALDNSYIDFLIALGNLKTFTDLVGLGTKQPNDLYRQKSNNYFYRMRKMSILTCYQNILDALKVKITIEL